MRDVLFEIGTEEMPHTYIISALKQINNTLPELLAEEGVIYKEHQLYATPRRLAVYIKGVEATQAVVEEEIKGPPLAVAYRDGEPTKALLGFLKKNGVTLNEIYSKQEGKKKYVYVKVRKGGTDVRQVLSKVFNDLIYSLRFPKMMRWGTGKYQFGRPVRWLVFLYGDEVIPFSLFGLQANRYSRGIRVFSGEVEIKKAEDYVSILQPKGMVIPDIDQRREIIRKGIQEKAAEVKGYVEIDEELLEEVNFLVEYPTPFVGSIEKMFLILPEIVVITVMKHHQRYFPIRSDNGTLLPYFIGVRNGPVHGIENVIKGNERVIRARLYDAVFFFNEDKKRSLESWRDDTKYIPFFEDMGTYLDKSDRVIELVDTDARKKIAYLMYADLPTNMVREFTELHGYMGMEYYKDVDSHIARGILDTIFPLYGQLPSTEDGAYVGLMDRLDTLATAAIKGIKLRGGGDVFGIRRAGLGIITLLDRYFPYLIWRDIAMKAAEVVVNFFGRGDIDEVYHYMTEVVYGRFKGYFDMVSYHALTAALSGWETKPFGAISTVAGVLDEMIKKNKDMMEAVAYGYKRIKNIVGQEDLLDDISPVDEWEIILYNKTIEVDKYLNEMVLYREDDVYKALKLLGDLSHVLSEFFDNVLVNHEDERIRRRRKALLSQTAKVFERVARFDRLGL